MARQDSRQKVGRRKRVRKFPSVEVQGPSSFVEFERPTWGEIRDGVNQIRTQTRKILGSGDASFAVARGGGIAPRGEAATELEDSLTDSLWVLAVDQFTGWNWVDDEGEPLAPLPELEMDDLLGDEVEFIFECIQRIYKMTDEEREGK